jgi:hypothetical protein
MTSNFKAGTYRTNITPPLGVSLDGTFYERFAEDVKEELFANALVLDDGEIEVALISVDVCSIPIEMVGQIKEKIEGLCGIPTHHILITSTHTHAGPTLNASSGQAGIRDGYLDVLKDQVASAARLAQLRKRPARLGAGRSSNPHFVFPRRLKRPNGSVVMNWIDKTLLQDCTCDGVVDPQVLVLRLEDEQGQPFCFIVNYANHNNACPPEWISADYAGVMGDHLRRVYGDHLVTLFLPGAAGNVNWIDYQNLTQYSRTLYRQIGKSLAGSVLDADAHLEYVPVEKIQIQSRNLQVLERPYTDYDIRVDGTFGPPESAQDFWGTYRKAYDENTGKPLQTIQVAIHTLYLGENVALVTSPVELFTEFGLEIKEKSPYPYTLVVELTDGSLGYVPTRQAFAEGGYEARKLPGNSVLAIEAGEQIVEASLELLKASRDENTQSN